MEHSINFIMIVVLLDRERERLEIRELIFCLLKEERGIRRNYLRIEKTT